ncbi:MAG: spore cortex biosynthesis protein YabQ [Hyphomonadaceae bacterium]|nr:spore cortex biosynthesis protein YabQ [Clostridia bacterium]
MGISIAGQTTIFLWSCVGGGILGILFDFFRALRKVRRSSTRVVMVHDLMFWVISACLMFVLIGLSNDGEYRAYEFLGIFLGGLLYHLLLSGFVLMILTKMLQMLACIVRFLCMIISYPLKIIWKSMVILGHACKKIGTSLKKIKIFRKKLQNQQEIPS